MGEFFEGAAIREFVQDALAGRFGLARTFWYGTLFNAACSVLEGTIFPAQADAPNIGWPLYSAFFLTFSAVWVMWVIGVWRASRLHTGRRLWAMAARGVIVLQVGVAVLAIAVVVFAGGTA